MDNSANYTPQQALDYLFNTYESFKGRFGEDLDLDKACKASSKPGIKPHQLALMRFNRDGISLQKKGWVFRTSRYAVTDARIDFIKDLISKASSLAQDKKNANKIQAVQQKLLPALAKMLEGIEASKIFKHREGFEKAKNWKDLVITSWKEIQSPSSSKISRVTQALKQKAPQSPVAESSDLSTSKPILSQRDYRALLKSFNFENRRFFLERPVSQGSITTDQVKELFNAFNSYVKQNDNTLQELTLTISRSSLSYLSEFISCFTNLENLTINIEASGKEEVIQSILEEASALTGIKAITISDSQDEDATPSKIILNDSLVNIPILLTGRDILLETFQDSSKEMLSFGNMRMVRDSIKKTTPLPDIWNSAHYDRLKGQKELWSLEDLYQLLNISENEKAAFKERLTDAGLDPNSGPFKNVEIDYLFNESQDPTKELLRLENISVVREKIKPGEPPYDIWESASTQELQKQKSSWSFDELNRLFNIPKEQQGTFRKWVKARMMTLHGKKGRERKPTNDDLNYFFKEVPKYTIMEIVTGRPRTEFDFPKGMKMGLMPSVERAWFNVNPYVMVDPEKEQWSLEELSEALAVSKEQLRLFLKKHLPECKEPYHQKNLDALFLREDINQEFNKWLNDHRTQEGSSRWY